MGERLTHLSMPPSEYLRPQKFCAAGRDEEFVAHVVDAFGDDNLVTTTDYPHGDFEIPKRDGSVPHPALPDRSKQKILQNNALRLYAL